MLLYKAPLELAGGGWKAIETNEGIWYIYDWYFIYNKATGEITTSPDENVNI